MIKAAQLARVRHFTPLRYPGGKAKLASYVKAIIKQNRLLDGEYVEPYAGGAAIALELLFHEYVSVIHINDVSKPIYAFWHSVLNEPEAFCDLILATPLTVSEWDKQKLILQNPSEFDSLQLGFATFFLNRTNRSGILNGGIIGGRDQSGPWKIDARYNSRELVRRVSAIAAMRDRVHLTQEDALSFLKNGLTRWPAETLIYLDPPYFVKGRDLYLDSYIYNDHQQVAQLITSVVDQKWIVSYDNVDPIRCLYEGMPFITYDIGYSARSASTGSEAMFFSKQLLVPPLAGPILLTHDGTKMRAPALD